MKLRKTAIFLVMILFYCGTVEGQSIPQIENTILKDTKRLNYLETEMQKGIDSYDSMVIISKNLLDYLKIALKKQPASISADFKVKNTGMNILTSDDGKVRIYCWYVGRGGTALSFDALIQYKTSTGTKVKVLNDDSKRTERDILTGSCYTKLYTYQTNDSGTVYLEIDHVVAWNAGGEYNAGAFAIKNNKLLWGVPFFKTSTKTKSSIGYEYDLSSKKNSKLDFKDINIKVSDDKQTLSIPLTTSDGIITGKYLVYKFDGNEFVFDKSANK